MRTSRLARSAVFALLLATPREALATMSAESFSTYPEWAQNAFFRGVFEAIEDEYYIVALGKYGTHDAAVLQDIPWSCIRKASPGTFVSMARDRMRQDRNLLPSLALRMAIADQCGGPDFGGLR
jgi:hypothetical protein